MATTLWQAAKAGWLVSLKCERTREGLKSAKACPMPITLHLPTLIAALGPDVQVGELQKRLRCPRCGSNRFGLRTTVPPGSGAGAADSMPKRRRMRPAGPGGDTLATTDPWIVVRCGKCQRHGQYKRATLLQVFPADRKMPDLVIEIAAWRGCALAKGYVELSPDMRAVSGPRECGIVYDVDVSS